jgi:hypothetical protein
VGKMYLEMVVVVLFALFFLLCSGGRLMIQLVFVRL